MEIKRWIETIQATKLLKSVKKLRRILETQGFFYHLDISKKQQLKLVWKTRIEWR